MVTPMIIAILGIPLFISACLNFFFIVAWNDMRKREKERRERIDHEGTPIIATVTGVEHQKEQRKYVVYAQWCSRETGKIYNFQETYKFRRGTIGIRPKIHRGDIVRVNILFNERMYRMVRR